MPNQPPEIMNVNEVADYLRVAPATIYRLAQGGKIPCGKVGRAWRFHRKAIDRWISDQPEIHLGSNGKSE
jgi:excisionase family DNA binding protein